MTYAVVITLKNGREIKWINGAIGYPEWELGRLRAQLEADNRVQDFRFEEWKQYEVPSIKTIY